MAGSWTYLTVELPSGEDREARTTELLNRYAAEGWRFVALHPQYAPLARPYAVLERPADGDLAPAPVAG